MNHANLLFPHPILRPNGFDYNNDCHFTMKLNQAAHINGKLHIELTYDLSSSTINDLIKNGKAKFFVVLKCTKTHHRIKFISTTTSIKQDLPISDFVDKLNITPYVATVEKIDSFCSKEHDDEIQQLSPTGIDLPTGAILAVGNSSEIIIDSIEKIQAAIKISPNDKIEEGMYSINTDGEYIVISVHSTTYNDIRNIYDKSRDSLYPSIYLSAIEHAIRDMKENEERKWAQALRNTLKKYNIETEGKIEEQAHWYAQMILEKPLTRILQWNNQDNEYDD